jgi:hypothetical protein
MRQMSSRIGFRARLIDIFIALPSVRNSKSAVRIDDWLRGIPEPVVWDEEFDNFVEWVNGVMSSFASWLMRACSTLAQVSEGWSSEVDWQELSEFCELGVNTRWAVASIRSGVPASREVVAKLGAEAFDERSSEHDPLALGWLGAQISKDAEMRKLENEVTRLFPAESPEREAAARVVAWLQERI